ncbi:sporulation histidine kinase inhibitor Sda [Halobacillus yeomjeoni]|uniref:sporulation histidine kinase inhibitor Sda n=1 Tax=Halobacillus yeomjeoni TaxID=311194 RepID=UPI001CD21C44|nr:sporulation histidine kinase inhibitor Sda [Halobacillus yeomjeoni]MCA0985326.1 sporulation histidine kinase inhibitor Sda [Halobacillus yeomjeoni]
MNLKKLTDLQLELSIDTAERLQLDSEFIHMLKKELKKRKSRAPSKSSSETKTLIPTLHRND